jgi:hypothetical protein
MTPLIGNAGFSWDAGASTLRLRTRLREFRARHVRTRRVRESLDYSVREVTSIGAGVHEVRALLRFEDDPGGLMDMLRAGTDGGLLHYHHRNWARYSGMNTDSDGNGVVDGWAASVGAGTVVHALDGAQKITVSGGVNGGLYLATQRVHGLSAGETWTLAADVKVASLSNTQGALILYYINAGGGVITAESVGFTNTAHARTSITRTLPTNTVSVDLAFGLAGTGASASGQAWAKDVQFEQASTATAYLPSYPSYLIEPAGDELETDLDADRGVMGDQSVELVLRSALAGLDYRLLVAPGT